MPTMIDISLPNVSIIMSIRLNDGALLSTPCPALVVVELAVVVYEK